MPHGKIHRHKVVAANWKMSKTPKEAAEYFHKWLQILAENRDVHLESVHFLFFVPALDVVSSVTATADQPLAIGIQNFYSKAEGAFTGETSLVASRDCGARWALVGHSERRSLFGEVDDIVAEKLKFAVEKHVPALLCIGETRAERESGQTELILRRQLVSALTSIKEVILASAVQNAALPGVPLPVSIAYEPVWAIGTGLVPKLDEIERAHRFIRHEVSAILNAGYADRVPILYGGSVKPENAREIATVPGVDGVLVGGASLDPLSFFNISVGFGSEKLA